MVRMISVIGGTVKSMENNMLTGYEGPIYTIYSGYGLKKLLTGDDCFGIKHQCNLLTCLGLRCREGKEMPVKGVSGTSEKGDCE